VQQLEDRVICSSSPYLLLFSPTYGGRPKSETFYGEPGSPYLVVVSSSNLSSHPFPFTNSILTLSPGKTYIIKMSTSGLVQATSPTDSVRLITFNRPEKRNALSRQLLDDFLVELKRASTDSAVKAIVISGNGTFFSGKPLLCAFLVSFSHHSPLHYIWGPEMLTTATTLALLSCSRCRSQRHCRTRFRWCPIMSIP
jgi:hypothetical protein